MVGLHVLGCSPRSSKVSARTRPARLLAHSAGVLPPRAAAALLGHLLLGENWNTRVLVVPGTKLVRRGPYRYLSHPNYVVVAVEIATFPLIFGAWVTALVFSILNAAPLREDKGREPGARGTRGII